MAYAVRLGRIREEEKELKVSVFVSPKEGVLDPQGQAALKALRSLGFDEVEDVRVGRYITLELKEADGGRARERVEEMCRKLLANPVIEDFRVEI